MRSGHSHGVVALYTTPAATSLALETAWRLSGKPGEPVKLVVTLLVPYPLPLNRPPVSLESIGRLIRRVASDCAIDTAADLYLCRDRYEALRDHLPPRSLVVLGSGGPRWWGSPEDRLARWLQANGHTVVFATPEKGAGKSTPSQNVLQFRMPNSIH